MRLLLIFVASLIMPAAVMVATSAAVINAPSGDACSITGSGTNYTAVINIPANGVEQGAFAFGAPGGTVTNIAAVGATGTVSTTGLPANTNAALMMPAAAVPGASVTVSLTTSRSIPGAFTVVPANIDGTVWFDPVVCQHPVGTATPSNKFTAQKTRDLQLAKTGVWRKLVTVPGPRQADLHPPHTRRRGHAEAPGLERQASTCKGRPGYSLTLKPTPAGLAALKAGGRIKLSLNIQYLAHRRQARRTRLVALTLKK